MNLGCIFANAIVRRLAYVVVAIALAWLGVGEARAQVVPSCVYGPTGTTCTREEAYQACLYQLEAHAGAPVPRQGIACQLTYTSGGRPRYTASIHGNWATGDPLGAYLFFWGSECPVGYVWDDVTKSCGLPCDGKNPISNEAAHAPGDSDVFCSDGCAYTCSASSLTLTVDGETRTVCAGPWTTSGTATCNVQDTPAPIVPVTDTDGDGISDGNDSSPNNPGAGGGGPEDGSDTGNPDAPGSGQGNTSGGGGDCNTPPRSTGDAILAQIAFQTWATRCALVGNANAGSGTGSGDGDGDGDQPDWTKGDGPAVPTDDTDYVNDQTRFGLGISPDLLDQENIFGNASCPAFELNIWTVTVSSSDVPGWCTLVTILRGLILIFGAFSALQILMGRGLV